MVEKEQGQAMIILARSIKHIYFSHYWPTYKSSDNQYSTYVAGKM